jgi:hypothetical protein
MKRKRTNSTKGAKGSDLTYAEALEAAGRARVTSMAVPISVIHPLHPKLQVDPAIQVKLVMVTKAMVAVGRSPGDLPVTKFDRPVRYRRLKERSLEWLERFGIPARRDFAPLAARDYIWLFGNGDRLPVSEKDAGRFFSRLIHCLLIETQILIAKQYYHGLSLYKQGVPLSMLSEALPSETIQGMQLASLNTIDLDQLHGMIFLEYCAVMIRAQWDKLTRLSCLVFGLKWNWGSISEGWRVLEKIANEEELHPWCRHHLQVFVKIAQDRLAGSGWLKRFRDPLLHDVGQHSAGVVPHKKSLETTSEMWDKVCDEHDWLREAMMAALVVFLSAKAPVNSVS